MAKYDIQLNPMNFGLYTFFEHDGQQFYADLCDIPFSEEYLDYENECMIFSSKDEQVTNWHELYCKRDIPVTEEALIECIEEFIKLYDEGK